MHIHTQYNYINTHTHTKQLKVPINYEIETISITCKRETIEINIDFTVMFLMYSILI